MLNILQLVLHILAQLQIQCRQGLVQQKHLGLIDQCARNGNSLLLSSRKRVNTATLKAPQVHHCQHILHLGLDLRIGTLFEAQTKGDIVKNIEVGEQRITLKHRIDLPFIRRHVVDALTVEINVTLIGRFESSDDTQRGRFSASGRAQKRDKLLVMDFQTHVVQNGLSVKRFRDSVQPNQYLFVHSA